MTTVILVSPAFVDGYPPVQYQASILADAGIEIELITQRLPDTEAIGFRHSGVRITALRSIPRGLPRIVHLLLVFAQMLQFIVAVTAIRLRRGCKAVEIAFDPNGIMISDYALFRPRRRIAHLHETVQRLGESHLETRLPGALARYSRVVVADEGRAVLLREQMGMAALPYVTPNYPMKDDTAFSSFEPTRAFEVIYGGSLGNDQMIALIIRSVPLWPRDARLVLLGDDKNPHAQILKALVTKLGLEGRVVFEGWMNLNDLLARYRKAQLGISLLRANSAQWIMSIGASNKRYQYMQAGLPQIGDQIPGVPELLEKNGIGRCISEYNEEAIADIVRYYHANPAERLKAGRKARELHLDRYNYQAAFEPTLQWIREGDSA